MPVKPTPCGICHKNIPINCRSVFWNNCNSWVHIKCNSITVYDYAHLQSEPDDIPWFCLKCIQMMFPCGSLDNKKLLSLYDFDFPSFVNSVPSFEIVSDLTNLANLDEYDIDEHLPSNVNSGYHTL